MPGKLSAITTLVLGIAMTATAGKISVTHLDKGNTLVRVEGTEKLLIFPVEESKPDSRIRVLVNGNQEAEFYVRLADKSADYEVPFDIAPFLNRGEVLLNITSDTNPQESRRVSDFVCWDRMRLADSFDDSNREKYRPAYHHTPRYGWMNDPNGMFYKDGEWHLCYQWNPYGSKWQNMTWGHSKSRNLVDWEVMEPAIRPDGLGTIFSGSAVVDKENTAGFGNNAVVAIYTTDGVNQLQNLAYSTDNGKSFIKLPANPIIATPREARDPNMFFNPGTGKWNMILASPLDQEMLIFSSADLKNWELESSFGKGYGAQEGVWECPDLLKMPVDGGKTEKWVLICNLNPGGIQGGSATQYFIGDFDGHRFVCDSPSNVTKWMDYGKDHYAAVTWSNLPDDRHMAIAWMSNWEYAAEVPTMQYRSANTLPRELSLFRATDGEIYMASAPSAEMLALRGNCDHHGRHTLTAKPTRFNLPELCEIVADIDFGSASEVVLSLANDKGEKTDIVLHRSGMVTMDRTESGLKDFSDKFPCKTSAPLLRSNADKNARHVKLRIFLDRSSVELFANDGKTAMTNIVFPTEPYNSILLSSDSGKAGLESIDLYNIDRVNN